MSKPAKEWAFIAEAFKDGQVFTIAEAAEAIRPHVNPMVAVRAAEKRRVSPDQRLSWDSYESRRIDSVTRGLRDIAWERMRSRVYQTNAVEQLGGGKYRLVAPPTNTKGTP